MAASLRQRRYPARPAATELTASRTYRSPARAAKDRLDPACIRAKRRQAHGRLELGMFPRNADAAQICIAAEYKIESLLSWHPHWIAKTAARSRTGRACRGAGCELLVICTTTELIGALRCRPATRIQRVLKSGRSSRSRRSVDQSGLSGRRRIAAARRAFGSSLTEPQYCRW